jgi:hypothetical protein
MKRVHRPCVIRIGTGKSDRIYKIQAVFSGGGESFSGNAKAGSIAPQVVHSRQRMQPDTFTF